ncbi:MAG: hypothetical protein SGBAC_010989 [Bacillariaceae sp.]
MSAAFPFIYLYEPPPNRNTKTRITHVVIHKSILTIAPNTFRKCERLVEVVFAEGLESICTSAFEKCTSLESASLPSTVTIIGKYAFRRCSSLSEVRLPQDGTILDIDAQAFEGCQSLCGISFPESTKTVGYQAFANCVSLLGVEIPSNTKMKFARHVFQGCHKLANVSIPMSMPSFTEKTFVMCASLQKCYPACDFPEALVDRNFKLPLHSMCYHASKTKLSDLRAFIEGYDKYDAVDRWGMTAYHILVTSATLRNDLLKELMDRYPLDAILQKDRNDKTMLDYLLLYKTNQSMPIFQMVLQRLLASGMGDWGLLEWRSDISSLVESSYDAAAGVMQESDDDDDDDDDDDAAAGDLALTVTDWEETLKQRHSSFLEITNRLAVFGRKEVTSLMELASWKLKIKESEMSRADSRLSCGSDFMISHVVEYLWPPDAEPSDGLVYLNL